MRRAARSVSLLIAALLLGSCGGGDGGGDEDPTLHLDAAQCAQLNGNYKTFVLYDRIPLELKGTKQSASLPSTGADQRAGDKGRLGRFSCKQGIVVVSQYAGNTDSAVATHVTGPRTDRLYRVTPEGGGPEGWLLVYTRYAGFMELDEETRTALNELPIATGATTPLNPGAPPDLTVEGDVQEQGEECFTPGVISPTVPITIANRGSGSGSDTVQVEIDGQISTFELNRPLEPGEVLVIALTLGPGQTATVDPKARAKESEEKNNSFSVPTGPPLRCVPQG